MADDTEKSVFGGGSSSGSVPAAKPLPRSSREEFYALRTAMLADRRARCRGCGRSFAAEDADWLVLVRTEKRFLNGVVLCEERLLCEDCRQIGFPF